MKKTVLALFSISLTAGTIYFTYSKVKDYYIKKLVSSWLEAAKKQEVPLDEKYLTEQLDKLTLLQIRVLSVYWAKSLLDLSKAELEPYAIKLRTGKIMEKADLSSLKPLFKIK